MELQAQSGARQQQRPSHGDKQMKPAAAREKAGEEETGAALSFTLNLSPQRHEKSKRR